MKKSLIAIALLALYALPAFASTSYKCTANETGDEFNISVSANEIDVTQDGNSYKYVFLKEGSEYKAHGDFSQAPASIDVIKSFDAKEGTLHYTMANDTSGTSSYTAKCR